MIRTASDTHVVDVLGIGFGPSNIALAIDVEERGAPFSAHFIEAAEGPDWQPQMLLDGSDIQNNPLRDLVTPRNPQSRYTFANYLKCEGRLFDFLNLGIIYPLRKDYARYIRWVARQFDRQVTYSARADAVGVSADGLRWRVETGRGVFEASALVVGTGRSRNIPEVFAGVLGERVFHLSDYLGRTRALAPQLRAIAVIGASQSAAEIDHDLMARFPDLEIHAIHRSFSMRLKDESPFSDHVYFPEFIDYYFSIDEAGRRELDRQLRPANYGSVDMEALHKLYMAIYEERLDGKNRFHLHNNTEIHAAEASGERVALTLHERHLGRTEHLVVDAVVLATGFRDLGVGEGKEPHPPLLGAVAHALARRSDGALEVARDYRVATDFGLPLYLNGLCESSHGLGDAGSFSLLSLRSTEIRTSLERALASAGEITPRRRSVLAAS